MFLAGQTARHRRLPVATSWKSKHARSRFLVIPRGWALLGIAPRAAWEGVGGVRVGPSSLWFMRLCFAPPPAPTAAPMSGGRCSAWTTVVGLQCIPKTGARWMWSAWLGACIFIFYFSPPFFFFCVWLLVACYHYSTRQTLCPGSVAVPSVTSAVSAAAASAAAASVVSACAAVRTYAAEPKPASAKRLSESQLSGTSASYIDVRPVVPRWCF